MTSTESPQTLTLAHAFQQAVEHHQAGMLQEAERLYRTILQIAPQHPDANHNLGVLALQVKQTSAALPHLKAALEANPRQAQYWLSYIDALILNGQPDAASHVLEQGRQLGLQGDVVETLARRLDTTTASSQSSHAPALEYREAGQYKEAAAWLQTWLASHPQDAEAYAHLAQMLSLDKRGAEAWPALERALSINPSLAAVQRNLARLLLKQHKNEEALQAALQARKIAAHDPENQLVVAAVLLAKGQKGEALQLLDSILQSHPRYAEAHATRAQLKLLSGDPVEALKDAETALSFKPHLSQLWAMTGGLRHQLQNLPGAIEALETALSYETDNASLMINLGEFKRLAGDLDAAVTLQEKAVLLAPENVGAWVNLGAALQESKRVPEAKAAYEKALSLAPGQEEVINNLGVLAKAEENWEAALRCFAQVLERKPDFAEAHNNLGTTLRELGRLEEAEGSFRQALVSNPSFVEAKVNLGIVLWSQGRLVESRDILRQTLETNPDCAEAHQYLSFVSAYLSDFGMVVAENDAALFQNPNNATAWEQRLYTFSYHPDLPAEAIYKEFVRWGDSFPEPVVDFSTHDQGIGRRLRIGYVSPDFRRHTSRFYFLPLFANHDHSIVETYAYSNVKHEDGFTRKFKGVFDHWRNIRGLSCADAARIIHEDQIDILVDCCNHMKDDRLDIFAMKPAPIQVTWLGAAWTTGLGTVDYVLFDPHVAPEGTLTRETIVHLPHFFVAYEPPEETAEMSPPPCLKNDYITFGYSGRTERLNHRTFRVWGEILRLCPKARLVLDYRGFDDPPTQEHYRQFLAQHGVDVSRVIMRKSSNIFEGLNDIDILLDCFPHSGGTMLFDALWMGVPVLTLKSRPPVGRIGTSLMMNIGLPEWVAETEEEYIGKAHAFASAPKVLEELRGGMRERMKDSPVMDGSGFARAVEAAYREMFTKWAEQA